ncbi:hypothetical protein VZT92_010741 [Zoarces viviparus]|uniref:Uncharacterized protein n=1 Tax=Zoarces viviparus TaxID=48416 RepID=A0AAW1F9I6_ZOAVI
MTSNCCHSHKNNKLLKPCSLCPRLCRLRTAWIDRSNNLTSLRRHPAITLQSLSHHTNRTSSPVLGRSGLRQSEAGVIILATERCECFMSNVMMLSRVVLGWGGTLFLLAPMGAPGWR